MSSLGTLLVVVVVISCCQHCVADVGNFTECLQFFYRSRPPKGLVGTPICQRYLDQLRFASLYSRSRRSPWFSAYLYTVPAGKRPSTFWKYEPQLADQGADGNMVRFPLGPVDQKVVASQGVELDYINSSYSRGHLDPSLHHQDHDSRTATFTLTNVVPQKEGSNEGPWELLEKFVNSTLSTFCLGEAFVVTGVIPYRGDDHWLGNRRVAVPEYLWSAYCCPHYNRSLPEQLKEAFPTYAAIGRNDPNSTEEIVPVCKQAKKHFLGYDVRQMSLGTLEMYLMDRFSTIISVFHEQCQGSD